MFSRSSFAVMILAVSGATCGLHCVPAFAEEPIAVGDRFVTIRRAELKAETTTLTTVEAGTELVATAVQDEWVAFEVQRDGSPVSGWIDIEDLRRIGTAEKGSGKAITTAEEFRETLDAMIRTSREAIGAEDEQYEPVPYVAFSLKVAQERIMKEGEHFRTTDRDVWRLAGINKVRGFVYDRDSEDLIVVGAVDPNRAPLTLDDLVVALRSRLVTREWPLVSIDPTVDSEQTNLQNVRFEGQIHNTVFGLDLLAADYELKGLDNGYVEPGIPGLLSGWDRKEATHRTSRARREEISSRFWFYPNLSVVVREDVCVVEGVKLGVYTQVLSAKIDGQEVEEVKGFQDASADGFAKEVSRQFTELAKNHYTLRRLQGLEELVGLSKALEDLKPQPELSWWLEQYRLSTVHTPRQLPVVRRYSEDDGRAREMSGGVHLTALAVKLNRGNVDALRDAVLAERPSAEALTWAFSVGRWIIPLPSGEISPGQIAQVQPGQIAPLFAQAVFLQEHERSEEALALYNRILKVALDHADAWCNKGLVLDHLGRSEKALDCYDRAIELKPDIADAWFNKGLSFDHLGRFEEALDCYDQAIKLKPDDAEACCNKGMALCHLRRFEESLGYYDRAIKLKPDLAIAWYNKGIVLDELGRSEEALDYLERSIELKPNAAEAWYNKGTALFNLGRHKEALECYDRAIKLKPDFADAEYSKCAVLMNLGRFEEGLECCDRAIKLEPDLGEAWVNKGLTLFFLKRYGEAKTALQEAAKLGAPNAKQALELIHQAGH